MSDAAGSSAGATTTETSKTGTADALVFAQGCEFTRNDDGKVSFTWNNGNALEAIKGASVDYIEPHFHMAVNYVNQAPVYNAQKDLGRLIAGGINAKLAMVVVGMRKVMLSFAGVTLNAAELHTVVAGDSDGVVPEADWTTLRNNRQSYRAIIDASATIVGLNGISVLLKGHHYMPDDTMWGRLQSALELEDHFTRLNIPTYDGAVFHDALHSLALEWKVSAVANMPSPLIGHVNGVLLKRLPGIPAGTALVFVTQAAFRELTMARPAIRVQLEDAMGSLAALATVIRMRPLDWCAMFQRATTAANLSRVAAVEPLAAIAYGAYWQIFGKRASIMKSKAFQNNAGRHPAMVEVGRVWAESLGAAEYDEAAIRGLLATITADVNNQTAAA